VGRASASVFNNNKRGGQINGGKRERGTEREWYNGWGWL